MSKIVEKVDQFIQRFYDLEIVISQNTLTIQVNRENRTLVDSLGEAITLYLASKNNNDEKQSERTLTCFAWINKLYVGGLVTSGNDLNRKLDEARQQNRELTKDLAICMANYKALENKHNQLLKDLNPDQSENWKKQEQEENNEQS